MLTARAVGCYPPDVIRVRCAAAAACVAVTIAGGSSRAAAIDAHIDREAIDEAIVFARQATRDRRHDFHDGYVAEPGGAIRRLSIVSEYRRVVLLVEEKMRLLDRGYGVRQMTDALKPWRGLLEVVVELQFHPQNTYVGVPLVVADATDRIPHFGRYWDPPPMDAPWWPFPHPGTPLLRGSDPLTGGWVQARFDASQFRNGRHDVVVKDGATTLGQATFDFGALR
jgi:hypothetical protein